jgi:hypothetical protein
MRVTNGLEAGELVHLYAAEDLPEISDNYSARQNAPGYLLIGGDGGGSALMLELGGEDPPVFIVGHGSMHPDDMEPVAESLSSWIEAGFPLPEEEYDAPFDVMERVDVYLERMPATGLKGLMRVKKELILDIGMVRLKELSQQLPALLVSGEYYGTASQRCAKVNAADDCVRIRAEGASPDSPGYE